MASLSWNSATWTRDSHGLYDYECNKIVKSSHAITGCVFIQRVNNDTHVWFPGPFDPEESWDVLATITFWKGKYWVYHSISDPHADSKNNTSIAWLIVK